MKCPFCNNKETKVTNSREIDDKTVIKRRRKCLKCETRFNTYETSNKSRNENNNRKTRLKLKMKFSKKKRLSSLKEQTILKLMDER